jgi:D-alanyl-D-alanine carboxypeptidase
MRTRPSALARTRVLLLAPLCLALAALAVPTEAGAQPAPSGDLVRAADALVDAVFKGEGPGGTIIVVKDGRPVYRAARGLANVELGVALQPRSVMRIGSVTKQFTSAAVMMLVEQGKLSLDDDITKVLPDYPTRGARITIEHLLTHTSGIKSYTSLPAWRAAWGRDFTPSELIDFFKNEPADFAPGEKYLYNNSAYFLLGAVIEKVSGATYKEFLGREIFTPLGMTDTRYGDTRPLVRGRAEGYDETPAGIVNAEYLSMTQPGAAGALVSTVDDLARWDQAIVSGRLLKAESWARIFTPYRLKNGKSTAYGYGWSLGTHDGHAVQEHGGGIHGFSAYVIRLPEDRVYVAVLSNCANRDTASLARKLAALAAGKPLVDPPAVTLSAADLAEYAGVYDFDDVTVTVTAVDGGLRMDRPGSPSSKLVPSSRDHFFVRGSFSRFVFGRDAAGKVVGVSRTAWNTADGGRKR